ncbi:hypothetical protein LTR01_003162 [Friedmanniomyces endolithicus]|nr:hypothetical protein LTR01_003162 [Friedmanniomyces endolithicus]KAK0825883.1 hypothetical protein LTR73_006617 [Friedmanniomyces endolithicus]
MAVTRRSPRKDPNRTPAKKDRSHHQPRDSVVQEPRETKKKRAPLPRKCKRATTPDTTGTLARFPTLPTELRNAVYEYSALHCTAVLCPNARVRAEFAAALHLTAPVITARVENLDFSHLVTFLNQTSDRELRALPSVTNASARSINIELCMFGRGRWTCCLNWQDLDSLHRWLLRCEHPTKRGADLEVSYTVLGTWVDRRLYYTQQGALERMEKAGMGEGRVYGELKKIVAALEAQKR